jgi:hypothetical protein
MPRTPWPPSVRTAGRVGPRADAAFRRVPDDRPEDRDLAAPAMAA